MATTREPFVSGLPSGDLKSSLVPPVLRMLLPARSLLVDQIEELAPLCLSRWDGVERHPPDEVAIAKRASLEAIVELLDVIAADDGLGVIIAQRMRIAKARRK